MARDLNIGIPTETNFTKSINVNNFGNVIASVEASLPAIEEAVEELKKIRVGTGLILGQEIEEAE